MLHSCVRRFLEHKGTTSAFGLLDYHTGPQGLGGLLVPLLFCTQLDWSSQSWATAEVAKMRRLNWRVDDMRSVQVGHESRIRTQTYDS